MELLQFHQLYLFAEIITSPLCKSLVVDFCNPNSVIDFSVLFTYRKSLLKSLTDIHGIFPFQYSGLLVLEYRHQLSPLPQKAYTSYPIAPSFLLISPSNS